MEITRGVKHVEKERFIIQIRHDHSDGCSFNGNPSFLLCEECVCISDWLFFATSRSTCKSKTSYSILIPV